MQIEGAARDLKGDIKGRAKDLKGEAKVSFLPIVAVLRSAAAFDLHVDERMATWGCAHAIVCAAQLHVHIPWY